METEYKVRQNEKLNIEIAKKFIKWNLANEYIAENTGLSLEQTEKLRE